MTLPYAEIETLFLDAGNTLISMNYEWVAAELGDFGVRTSAELLRRAEARARPATSARVAGARSGDDYDLFVFHLTQMLEGLDGTERERAPPDAPTFVTELAARLKKPGQDYRLWSWVLPGVPGALEKLHALGMRLAVVSNSDGTVRRALEELGLATHLHAVFDSRIVGFEKPDPRFFVHALQTSGATAARTVHVGDMYYQDVQGSRAAGLHSVLLDPYGDWQVTDCVRCRDLPELAERLERARA
jgi:HAD superfamily hydrolase (TIGR01509 family)